MLSQSYMVLVAVTGTYASMVAYKATTLQQRLLFLVFVGSWAIGALCWVNHDRCCPFVCGTRNAYRLLTTTSATIWRSFLSETSSKCMHGKHRTIHQNYSLKSNGATRWHVFTGFGSSGGIYFFCYYRLLRLG